MAQAQVPSRSLIDPKKVGMAPLSQKPTTSLIDAKMVMREPATLPVTRIDQTYVAADPQEGEHTWLRPGREGSIPETAFYSVKSADLFFWLLSPKKTLSNIKYIDPRIGGMAGFYGSKIMGVGSPTRKVTTDSILQGATEALDKWRTQHGAEFAELVKADYVVVYCDEGKNRSPRMVTAYASAWRSATGRNPNQQICLLNGGYDSWKDAKDWPDVLKSKVVAKKSYGGPYGQARYVMGPKTFGILLWEEG